MCICFLFHFLNDPLSQEPETYIERLQLLAKSFSHSVWLNPVGSRNWDYTRTIGVIRSIFPMYELSLDGLEQAVAKLIQK